MSGASVRFRWFIWNSHSKSEITRRPFTIVLRAPALRELDDELGEDVHLDVVLGAQGLLEEADALLDREHRLLVARLADDADDDPVEDRGGARDDVEVAERDRVVAPGADRGAEVAHACSKSVRRAEPYVRLVRSASGSSGCSLRGGLDDDEAVLGEERGR